MKPCMRNYGALPAMCRRLAGHEDDCGPGDDVEQAMCAALERTARVRTMELEGERYTQEFWDEMDRLILRGPVVQQPSPTPGTGGEREGG